MTLLDQLVGRAPHRPGSSGAFSYDDEAELRRPDRFRRITFEDEWFHRTYAMARHAIPFQLVQPGDEQVAVFCQRGTHPWEHFVDIDALAAFPSVESITGAQMVRLRTPLPQVRELFVTPYDDETLANLPNLERYAGGHPHKRPLDPAVTPPGLRDVMGSPSGTFERLGGVERLREGSLYHRSAEEIAHLRNLRWLEADFGKGLRHLGALEQLEVVSLDVQEGPTVNHLRFLPGGLRHLRVTGRRLRSLEGLPSVEALFLYRPGVTDLAPLRGLPRLSRVRLDGPDKVSDLSPLTELPALEWLRVEFHAHTNHVRPPSLPGVEVEWWVPYQRDPDIEVGPIGIDRLDDGSWSIFQDMTDLLGAKTNHEAEDRIRCGIDSALRARLEFDSEGDAVGITATSEADIRAAALAILALRA